MKVIMARKKQPARTFKVTDAYTAIFDGTVELLAATEALEKRLASVVDHDAMNEDTMNSTMSPAAPATGVQMADALHQQAANIIAATRRLDRLFYAIEL